MQSAHTPMRKGGLPPDAGNDISSGGLLGDQARYRHAVTASKQGEGALTNKIAARCLHDLGLAPWFGGALSAAGAFNPGAAADGASARRDAPTRIAAAQWPPTILPWTIAPPTAPLFHRCARRIAAITQLLYRPPRGAF
jgi:hypothetical protein